MSGRIIIISGPSQVGKDTIVAELLKRQELNLARVITVTTREKRPEEQEGRDHFFVSEEKFKEMIQRGIFLEWTPVRNRLFGAPKDQVDQALKEGKNVLMKIDVRGATQVIKTYPSAVRIFVEPDSLDAIWQRMVQKGFPEEQLKVRWQEAMEELKAAPEYDYKVVNREGKVADAVEEVAGIIKKI